MNEAMTYNIIVKHKPVEHKTESKQK